MSACASFASAIDDVALGAPPSRALAEHVATCAECATQLEHKRALAQRIDRAVSTAVRIEPSPGLADRIGARIPRTLPQRRSSVWIGVPAAIALAAGLLFFISTFDHRQAPVHATDISALTAWRSPTASLLVAHGNVLGTPFTLPSLRYGSERSRS